MASQKIDPLSVITQHTPTPEQPKSASSWFKTERMELDFGDYVGRPSENVTAHTEALSQLLADGWYVTEVSHGGSSGEWKRVCQRKSSRHPHGNRDRHSHGYGDKHSHGYGNGYPHRHRDWHPHGHRDWHTHGHRDWHPHGGGDV